MRYPVCKECGSDRVWSDAVAFYDDTTQGWDIADANEVHFGCNACDYDDVSIEWRELKEIHSYKDTSSEAGQPQQRYIRPGEVAYARVWVNGYGNPTYCLHMVNGDTHLLVDDYGAMNGIDHLSANTVRRRKELF